MLLFLEEHAVLSCFVISVRLPQSSGVFLFFFPLMRFQGAVRQILSPLDGAD